MTYGYIRVSSDKQTVENQRFEINNFCKKESINIDGWIEETISGTKNYDKRKLGDLLNQVQKDDLIICAELSRLGRNTFEVLSTVKDLIDNRINVYFQKKQMTLLDNNSKPSLFTPILIATLSTCAEMERENIQYRLNSGRRIYIEKGVLAKSNGEMVAKVVRMAKELGREVATSAEAREILGLKPRK